MQIKCDQCEMLSINGVACHETGCPNADKAWHNGEWCRVYECPECGQEYTERDERDACCNDFGETDDFDTDSDEDSNDN